MPLRQPDVTVECPTTEEALAEVTARLGPAAEIVSAQKVARGGIGGFFAREMVQIVARPAAPEPPPQPGIAGVLDRLAVAADAEEARFQDVLRRELGNDLIDRALSPRLRGQSPAAQPTEEGGARLLPQPVRGECPERSEGGGGWVRRRSLLAPDALAPPGMGPPAWSVAALNALDVPARFGDAVDGLHRAHDGAWIQRLAAAAAPLLGPVPDGPLRLAGPGAGRLATVLGVPADPPGARAVHLVLGGGATNGHAIESPAAVSWVSDGGIAGALHVAEATGCPLAYGGTGGFPVDIVRLTPVDVALAIRRLVGRA